MARITPNKNDIKTLNNKAPLRTKTNGMDKSERDIKIYDLYKLGRSVPAIASMFYPVINPIWKDIPEPNVEKYYRIIEDIIQRQIELETANETANEECETDHETEAKKRKCVHRKYSDKSGKSVVRKENKSAKAIGDDPQPPKKRTK